MSEARIWRRRASVLAGVGVFLAGNLAFFLWYRSTTRERQHALLARRDSVAEEARQREEEASRLSAQRDRLSQIAAAIEDFYGRRIGSSRETLASVVAELHAVLARVGVSPKQISYTTDSVKELPLSEMVINFGFDSDYPKFKRLLAAFETNRRWIVVRETAVVRDSVSLDRIQVRLQLATYFSEDGEARPAARAQAAAVRRRP